MDHAFLMGVLYALADADEQREPLAGAQAVTIAVRRDRHALTYSITKYGWPSAVRQRRTPGRSQGAAISASAWRSASKRAITWRDPYLA